MEFLCEHVVERKKQGLYRFKKFAIGSAWVIVPLIFIFLCLSLSFLNEKLQFLWWSVFLVPVFVIIGSKLGPITIAYGDESFEYTIATGEMSFAKIYGNRFRKEWFSFNLPSVEACAPYVEGYNTGLEAGKFDRVYTAVSSMSAPHIYYAIFRDNQDNRCIVYFEVIKKSLRMIKTYYPQTVMTDLPY